MTFIVAIFVWGGLLGGLGIIGWQVYSYLRSGEWIGVSIITGLQNIDMEWAHNPGSWVGLYQVLDLINLGVAVWISGLILGAVVHSMEE